MTIEVELFRDDLAQHFEKLNLEWIQRHFRVEGRDREVLGNPRREIVDHGGQIYSLYGQLASTELGNGAKVERGDVLGTAGRVLAGIPGMYFEMRVDGKPVDPLEWLRKR